MGIPSPTPVPSARRRPRWWPALRAAGRRALGRRRRRWGGGGHSRLQLPSGEGGDGRFGSGHHVGRHLVVRVELDHQALVGEIDVVGLATERAAADPLDQIGEHDLPVVHLVGDDDLWGQLGLVALRAEPQHAALAGHADRADGHLRRAGEHGRPAVDERRRRLGGKGGVTERIGVVDAHLEFGVGGRGAGDEAVDVELGVTDLDRPDDADRAVARQHRRHLTHDVATLVRRCRVRRDVGEAERVGLRTPRKGDVGEVGSDLGEWPAVLRAVGDDQVVVTGLGVAADRRGGVLDDEQVLAEVVLVDHLGLLEAIERVDDALRERQIVGRARHHDSDVDVGVLGVVARCGRRARRHGGAEHDARRHRGPSAAAGLRLLVSVVPPWGALWVAVEV